MKPVNTRKKPSKKNGKPSPRVYKVLKPTFSGPSVKIFTEGALRVLLKDHPEALQIVELATGVARPPIDAERLSAGKSYLESFMEGFPAPHARGDGKIILADAVNHPQHYNSHPSGVECIEIVRHMNFNLGNVVKYCWRADHKEIPIQDLEKAEFYLRDEIATRKSAVAKGLETVVSPKPQCS